uniref:Uncharacterized protein n=1 Tax=Oryza brachyantha TaxID=4533 RepID=J3L7T3_ORYBR
MDALRKDSCSLAHVEITSTSEIVREDSATSLWKMAGENAKRSLALSRKYSITLLHSALLTTSYENYLTGFSFKLGNSSTSPW